MASLAKWLSVRLQTKWLWVRVQLQSLKLQISHLLQEGVSWHSGNYRVWFTLKRVHDTTRTYRQLKRLLRFVGNQWNVNIETEM